MSDKPSHVGAPAIFLLTICCQQINDALGDYGCYLVGSSLEKSEWRDVDVRFIMDDAAFMEMFPKAHTNSALWEFDPKWLLFTTAISEWMKRITGLPIDFQIQPHTFANEKHDKPRHPIGLRLSPRENNQ